MRVELVSYSQPDPKFIDDTNTASVQELIAYCARVSNPYQMNHETSEKLLNYLLEHKHFSPFEMVNVTLSIETTRDIARQILRHRSFSFQEYSQRYADPTQDLSFEIREARLQDTKNRQNSISNDNPALEAFWAQQQQNVIDTAKEAYQWAIDNGIAKEQARAVLPEGNTKTKMYMNGTLRSWIHYIQLRASNGTQLEHIEIAKSCAEVISTIFPMSKEMIND